MIWCLEGMRSTWQITEQVSNLFGENKILVNFCILIYNSCAKVICCKSATFFACISTLYHFITIKSAIHGSSGSIFLFDWTEANTLVQAREWKWYNDSNHRSLFKNEKIKLTICSFNHQVNKYEKINVTENHISLLFINTQLVWFFLMLNHLYNSSLITPNTWK